MTEVVEEVKERRRLVDLQYYYETDQVFFHERINGERVYSTLDCPELVYGIRKANAGPPQPSDFFLEKEKIDIKSCSYIGRYREIGEALGYKKSDIQALRGEAYQDFKRQVMTDPRLYFADNSITFQEKVNYLDRYGEDLDYSMPLKVMSFDIEVHDDYSPEVYEAITTVASCLDSTITADAERKLERALNVHTVLGFVEKCKDLEVSHDSSYKTILAQIYHCRNEGSSSNIQYRNDLIKMVSEKAYRDQYESKMGFPDEEFANNRIDAISAYDDVENIMYLKVLVVEEDIQTQYGKWLHDADERRALEVRIEDYLNMVKMRVFLRSDRNFGRSHPELIDEFVLKSEGIHDRIGMDEYYECLGRVVEILGEDRSKEIMGTKLDLQFYDEEIKLLESFFFEVRHVIQPDFTLAHNNKFDFLTLFNRLVNAYHRAPELYFNQFGPFFTDEDLPHDIRLLPINARFDYNAANYKQDKSFIKVPGIVWLDSMLLVAKMTNGERDFSLDGVSRDNLKETKFQYKGVIQQLYLTNTEHFMIYSAVDTLLVHLINKTMGLVENFESTINGSYSTWSEHSLKSVYITNTYKYDVFKDHGMMTRVNLNVKSRAEYEKSIISDHDDEDSTEEDETKRGGPSFKGAYVTNLRDVNTYGIHEDVYDMDASAFYPRIIIEKNVMSDRLLGQWRDLNFYQEALLTDRITFGSKYLGTCKPEVIFDML